jgi:RNA polymerase sigma factor (sigma-70 family)
MSNEILEKDCFKFTEKLLYNYKEMQYHINTLEYDIKKLKAGDILSIRAIRYDDIKTSPTNNVSKQTEDKVINIVSYIQDLEIEAYKEKKLKNTLERAINNLEPTRKQTIKLRYFEGMGWTEMAQELYHDEKTLRKYKNQAIKSIAVELFGSKVFKEEEPNLFDMLAI